MRGIQRTLNHKLQVVPVCLVHCLCLKAPWSGISPQTSSLLQSPGKALPTPEFAQDCPLIKVENRTGILEHRNAKALNLKISGSSSAFSGYPPPALLQWDAGDQEPVADRPCGSTSTTNKHTSHSCPVNAPTCQATSTTPAGTQWQKPAKAPTYCDRLGRLVLKWRSEMLCKELFHLQANLQKWMNSQKPWAEQAPVEEDLFALWPNIRSFHTLTVPTMIYDKHWKGLLPVELMHRWPRLPNTKSPSFVCVRDIKPQAPERLPQRVQWRAAVRRWCQLHSAGSLHFRMANLRRHRFLYKAHLEASKSWPSAEWCV